MLLRLVMSGMSDSVERVNQGGLLGWVLMRVFFAAVEMDDARFGYNSFWKNDDATSA